MGYPHQSTAAPGITEQQRRHALGEAMDAHTTQCILAIARAWDKDKHPRPAELPAATYLTACMLSTAAAAQEQLQCLPIKGLGYRWGVDLAGPLPDTPRGHKYVMICVEHFSKHIEAIPIADKPPECTSYAFLHNDLARFCACAEVVHDNCGEWGGAFAQLLLDALIDPCHTSANHPQANGMTEKSVQTVKRALKKMCLDKRCAKNWDLEVPWLLLGYRCSPQKSTYLLTRCCMLGSQSYHQQCGRESQWAHRL
jgi:hypothetical protein